MGHGKIQIPYPLCWEKGVSTKLLFSANYRLEILGFRFLWTWTILIWIGYCKEEGNWLNYRGADRRYSERLRFFCTLRRWTEKRSRLISFVLEHKPLITSVKRETCEETAWAENWYGEESVNLHWAFFYMAYFVFSVELSH